MMNDQTEYEVYREIWEIISFRDGAVYKTRYLRDDWAPMGSHGDGKRLLYVPISDPDRQRNPRRKGVKNDCN